MGPSGTVGYTWDAADRLRMLGDGLRGPIHYSHDALGNLVRAHYHDSALELRMPDAVGNLFRAERTAPTASSGRPASCARSAGHNRARHSWAVDVSFQQRNPPHPSVGVVVNAASMSLMH